MSAYTIKNIISKNLSPEISILYTKPDDFKWPDIILKLSEDNLINVYSSSDVKDISILSYDMVLTHQINQQIVSVAHMLHAPILCVVNESMKPLIESAPNTKNITVVDNNVSYEQLYNTVNKLKNTRYVI